MSGSIFGATASADMILFIYSIPIAMCEVLDSAPHAKVALRCRYRIAQSHREGNAHVSGDGQDVAHTICNFMVAYGAQNLHADAQTFCHQPQILHDAAETHDAERIFFGLTHAAVVNDDQQRRTSTDRATQVRLSRPGSGGPFRIGLAP